MPTFFLEEELYPVKCLELKGLYNNEILQKLGLKDSESWSNLIDLYEGNPVYLKEIVYLINNMFEGKVSDFLAENTLFLTENMRSQLKQLFNKLSVREQQIVLELSKNDQPISKEDLKPNLSLSSQDLIKGLQSLQRRYLIKKIKEERILFNLFSIFKEYLKSCS